MAFLFLLAEIMSTTIILLNAKILKETRISE